jgi:hypothetical protein
MHLCALTADSTGRGPIEKIQEFFCLCNILTKSTAKGCKKVLCPCFAGK